MSTPVRIAGFVAGLAALFGVALAVGTLVGPTTEPVVAHDEDGIPAYSCQFGGVIGSTLRLLHAFPCR